MRTVSVNIWDLIRARETGDLPGQKYETKTELRVDLRNSIKRFPLAKVKCSGDNKLLRAFLVNIA